MEIDFAQVGDWNKLLKEFFGYDLRGRPNFRLVWTPNQYEKRFGSFTDFYGSIIIREVEEVREVPKYPYLPPCWILEKLVFSPHPHLVESGNGHYELFWAFLTKDRKPVTPTFTSIIFLIRMVLWGPRKTKSYYEDQQSAKDRKEIAEMAMQVDEAITAETAYLRKQSAVFVTGYQGQKSLYSQPGTRVSL